MSALSRLQREKGGKGEREREVGRRGRVGKETARCKHVLYAHNNDYRKTRQNSNEKVIVSLQASIAH